MQAPDNGRSGGERGHDAFKELDALAASATLALDPRSREERALKLAGYSHDQIRTLLARAEATIRRAA